MNIDYYDAKDFVINSAFRKMFASYSIEVVKNSHKMLFDATS
jgi:hypothetical protein